MEFFAWTTTFAELPYEMRSSFTSPGIWVQACHDNEQKKDVGGYETMLRFFRTGKEYLIRGIPMYVKHLKRLAMVFSCFHGLQGDAPARTELAGFKRAGGRVRRMCHECDVLLPNVAQHLRDGTECPERQNFKAKARAIESLKASRIQEWKIEAIDQGINGYSRNHFLFLFLIS